MAIYSDIERERKNGAHFIKYDLKEMHPDIPDEFSTDFVWCKYWVDGVNGGASKRDVYRKNVANHDKYRYDGNSVVHKVEAALRNLPLMKNYPNAEKTISQFTDAISMNNKVINMHAGNASVDDVELIKACKNCKTPSDLSKVLRSLTAQVNAARLNSALSQVYDIANRIGKNTIPNDVDKSIENAITNIYNRCMNGDPKRKLKPIEIPSNPNEPFAAPDLIFKLCEKVKDKKGLTPQQVYKELVAPCETTVNKVIEAQKTNN